MTKGSNERPWRVGKKPRKNLGPWFGINMAVLLGCIIRKNPPYCQKANRHCVA